MANATKSSLDALNTVFVLSSMGLPREGTYAIIIIALPAYIFTVVSNLLLIGTIVSNRTLHEPMYILLCNLSLNDLIGITALVPRVAYDVMFEYGLITFPACVLQAWCLHTYSCVAFITLSVMAFDRYAAICHPLRYHSIMSKTTLICLIASSWIISFVMLVVLFGLTLQYPICRREISTYYCDNMTILKLTCATDTTVNNIYGLSFTALFHVVSGFSIVFTYTCILITCCRTSDSESKSKAWHTCGTHLTVYVIFEVSGCLLSRFLAVRGSVPAGHWCPRQKLFPDIISGVTWDHMAFRVFRRPDTLTHLVMVDQVLVCVSTLQSSRKHMGLPREGAYAIIIIALSGYIFTVVSNLLLIGTIVSNRTLHEPMYILLCNLSLNDLIGITALVPRVAYDVMFEYGLITFPACVLQAWCLHTYSSVAYITLSVMAFDRYAAICHPLRYHSIMSKTMLICLIASSWIITFVMLVVLFGLTLQYPICRREISTYYCDNVTILKLTCATDTTVNNIYGLFITALFHVVSGFSIVFTYTCILITCCRTSDSESKSKAWHTCGTHLTVYVIFEVSGSAIVLAHRFPNTPFVLRKITELSFIVIPSCLNPVIYGLNMKDIKAK
ncbi:hypothetical protein NFI96_015528, partial [Prochilodus magdalenae]